MRTFTTIVSAAALFFASAFAIPTIRQDQGPAASPIVVPSPSLPPGVDATIVPVPIQPVVTPVPVASPAPGTSPAPAQSPTEDLGFMPEGPEASESEEPSESPEDDDPICFPAHATVEKEDGSVITMEQVQVGDKVKVAQGTYSQVFMFTHRLADVDAQFVKITAAGKSIELTAGHYLYANGRMTAAKAVKVGDTLEIEGSCSSVEKIETVSGKGLFNPQTLQGDIVVDGVRSSTYTTAVEPSVAHWLLAPMRGLYKAVGFSTTVLDKGNYGFAALAPRGQAVY